MIVIVFLIILAVLILSHELGHFLVARRAGVKVEEFGLGFPPRLLSKKKKGTIYSLNLIPLGGFVRLKGEDGQDKEKGSLSVQPIWRQMLIVVAGSLANFLLAWFVLVVIFYQGLTMVSEMPESWFQEKPPAPQLIIGEVVKDSAAEKSGLAPGDIILDFSAEQQFQDFTLSHKGQEVVLKIKHKNQEEIKKIVLAKEEPALGVAVVKAVKAKMTLWRSMMVAGEMVW
ncbi:MAG: regulator of sigma E protease, partial [Candidatus Berkelbacteria bacterium Licking1014_2]